MAINYRDFILADFFPHRITVPLEKNWKKNRFQTDDINLLYQRQFPPIGHLWTDKKKKKKKRKWEDVTTSSFVDGPAIVLSHSKRFFLYMWRTLLLFTSKLLYYFTLCCAQSIDVRTYYTSILLITRLNNLET